MSHLTYSNYEGYGQRAKQDLWYSQAVRVGDVIECSGQGGWDRTTEAISPDIVLQIEQAFDNVERTLKVAGSKGWEDVFSIRSYHVPADEKSLETMVRCLKKYCPDHQPVWTYLGVPRLALEDMKVEIEVRAHVPQDKKAISNQELHITNNLYFNMADRFPSLEDFDSGAQTTQGDSTFEGGADDFLSREKALLGDDADQFATGNDNAAFVEDGDDDLLGGGGGGGEDVHEFESSFPAIDTRNENVSPSGQITSTYTNYQPQVSDEEEPEVIKQWRERRDLQLQAREERSEEKKQETIKTAQQNIDDFYENYNTKKEKTIAQTRREAEEFLASREDTSAGGTSWERIAKLVDLSGKGARGGANGTGKEKFRELLMSLKKDEKAPGATGY